MDIWLDSGGDAGVQLPCNATAVWSRHPRYGRLLAYPANPQKRSPAFRPKVFLAVHQALMVECIKMKRGCA